MSLPILHAGDGRNILSDNNDLATPVNDLAASLNDLAISMQHLSLGPAAPAQPLSVEAEARPPLSSLAPPWTAEQWTANTGKSPVKL